MADGHHSLRAPARLWFDYGAAVGDIGRAPDLKEFMAWQVENPGVELGDDVDPPFDGSPITLRVHPDLWDAFAACVPGGDCSARLRAYMNWRTVNPEAPLPGRRLGPLRRDSGRGTLCGAAR